MASTDLSKFERVSVIYEKRADGGLRVYSDDVPGFVLSSDDEHLVLNDVKPALETIITDIVGFQVRVSRFETISDPASKNRRAEKTFTPRLIDDKQTVEYAATAA